LAKHFCSMAGRFCCGLKRVASAQRIQDEKRQRTAEEALRQLLPDLPTSSGPGLITMLEEMTRRISKHPFGMFVADGDWDFKRRLYSLLKDIVAAASGGSRPVIVAATTLIDQLIRSGYANTILDRRTLVVTGAWKPPVALMQLADSSRTDLVAMSVRIYIYLAEHVNVYEDFVGSHPDFWNPQHFLHLLKIMPAVITRIPETIDADQWEVLCPDLEAACRMLGSFMLFWTTGNDHFVFDIVCAMPLLQGVMQTFDRFDVRFGKDISAKVRGDFIEEIVRLSAALSQFVISMFDHSSSSGSGDSRAGRSRNDGATRQATGLLNFLVRLLALQVPTCGPKLDSSAPGSGLMPIDERQLDTDWIEGLWEHCQGVNGEVLRPDLLPGLFKVMVGMPLPEQKYRLECVAPLVFPFISKHQEQLRQKTIPPELSDLKVVINAVLQDDASVNSDFLEEISFYPCLLEFATKRATVHAVCEHVKLQMSTNDPIRLVVPRDNVLDGVCSSLNLQDQNARIDVPVEIEFRSGYADDTGKELVDEGEDQGGLRRQWLDRSSRHFISSDLFRSPTQGSTADRTDRGNIFVPFTESVCRCVQDDWEEQFELFGCILGFALLHKETVPVHFGHNFLRSVFGLKTDAQDLLPLLETLDRTLHTKVKYILDGSYTTLGHNLHDALDECDLPKVFAINETNVPELVASTPLMENGENIPVTEQNKEDFVLAHV